MSADPLSRTFAALADPTRRAILARLADGECTVGELARPFAMSGPAVSKHLKVLERAGLISRGRDAQWRPCRLRAAPIKTVAEWADDYRQFWDASYRRLDAYLDQLMSKPQSDDTTSLQDENMKTSDAGEGQSASQLISKRIADLGDWRGATLRRVRELIKEADPTVVEEWKWRGVPVWSHDGIICTGESYKNVVKLTFARGASLKDPARLFNSSLEGNARRAIDIHEGDDLDESAFKALVRQAVSLNGAARSKGSKKARS